MRIALFGFVLAVFLFAFWPWNAWLVLVGAAYASGLKWRHLRGLLAGDLPERCRPAQHLQSSLRPTVHEIPSPPRQPYFRWSPPSSAPSPDRVILPLA